MMANIRLSRLSHPRATLWAVALLIIVFLGFGLFAQARMPLSASSSVYLEGFTAQANWLNQVTAVFK